MVGEGVPDDVFGLYVVVDEVESVEVGEGAGLLAEEGGAVGWGEGAALLLGVVEVLVEAFAWF